MENNKKVKDRANEVLEAVAFLESRVKTQVNKGSLPIIKEISEKIRDGNYNLLHEFKGVAFQGRPEGSGPENDIFSMDVIVSGDTRNFGTVLDYLIEEVEKVL